MAQRVGAGVELNLNFTPSLNTIQEKKEVSPSLSCLVNSATLSFHLPEANVGEFITPFDSFLSEKLSPSSIPGGKLDFYDYSVCRESDGGEVRTPGATPAFLGFVPSTIKEIYNQQLSIAWENSISQRVRAAWKDFIPSLFSPEWFLHLTFKDCLHPEEADKRYFHFVHTINQALYGKRYKYGIPWFRGTEWQKRGAIHFHAMFGGGVNVLSRLQYKELWYHAGIKKNGQPRINGIARIYEYDPEQGGLDYMTKYVEKGGELDVYIPGKGIYHSLKL